jgi:hypothetical protein
VTSDESICFLVQLLAVHCNTACFHYSPTCLDRSRLCTVDARIVRLIRSETRVPGITLGARGNSHSAKEYREFAAARGFAIDDLVN